MEDLVVDLLVLEVLWDLLILRQIKLFRIVMAQDYIYKMRGS